MRKINNTIELSASDLSNHIACTHVSLLDLKVVEGILEAPKYHDPLLDILQERGMEFENNFLASLKDQGLSISDTDLLDGESAIARTVRAMQEGVDIIYQASLKSGIWQGKADFLKRVDKPSDLGNWSYEVIDSKLAKETRAGTILQICLYSQLIEDIQGVMPEYMHVMTPDEGFTNHSYRVDDFLAYHRLIQHRLKATVNKGIDNPDTYPNPVSHCDICRWWHNCDSHRRADDHLSLVAGLSGSHAVEIKKWKAPTLETFSKLPFPLQQRPSKGAMETFSRLREQARVQFTARTTKQPIFELLDTEAGKGLFKLPEPSEGDIFFDFESDPFVGTTGLEYLFGWVAANEPVGNYHRIWALSPEEEKVAFESFINMVMGKWQTYPDMHIYHYTAYETTALKRLMGKYATCEDEIDTMLRAGIFVDLHSVTKHTLRAGIESYSLKELEIYHGFERSFALRDASLQLRAMERLLERNNTAIPPEIIKGVEIYNKEDCQSTQALRTWLEYLRNNLIRSGTDIPRPDIKSGEVSEAISEHQQLIKPLYDHLVAGIPVDKDLRSPEQQGNWLLANMLDWYRREKKSLWWEFYRLSELPDEEMLDEKTGLSGLLYTGLKTNEKKSFLYHYTFPSQECELKEGDKLTTGPGGDIGEIFLLDLINGTVAIKTTKDLQIHPTSAFKLEIIRDGVKESSIIRLAEWVVNNGINETGQFRSGRDLLLGHKPRLAYEIAKNESSQNMAVEWGLALNQSVLPIQGPPGAGKSHTAANMILALIKANKKIGITALSHKVIRELLEKVVKAATGLGERVTCVQKVTTVSGANDPSIMEVTKNEHVLSALNSGKAQIAAGTSWLWADESFAEAVDVLFVDEAGQLSLIDTLAVSQSAKNMVLLGDPQQLKQPQKGSHPEGTDVSALEHILNGEKTIRPEAGIFLNETWRMHPNVCALISELFYESRLNAKPDLINQTITSDTFINGAGLWMVPVEHEGNQNSSIEEAQRVVQIFNDLLYGNTFWTDKNKISNKIKLDDVLVIAPYNAQVLTLTKVLPEGARIGTVDKFQGQEAPVVIFSMTTSSPTDAPRGMEFLYSLNRLNVAISRSKSACVIVANPQLFEPDCKNPEQMRLANAFCRYLEMSTII